MPAMNANEVLQESPWSPDVFRRALAVAASNLNKPDGADDALKIVVILSEHLALLQALGKGADLRTYSDTLHSFLAHHPRLTRLRDLEPAVQFGVRLDTLFQDLYVSQHIATPASARDALNTDSRRRILEVLVETNDWIKTPDLVERCNLSSRQHLHQTLPALREAGLVQSTAGPTSKHAATLLGHQVYREMQEEIERNAPKQSLLKRISQKEHIDPNTTGIDPQSLTAYPS